MSPPTFLGLSRGLRVMLVVGLTVVGATLGWFLPWLTRWALDLPWVPFRAVLRVIDSAPDPWLQYGATCVGLLIGAGFSALVIHESLAIRITDQQVELKLSGTARTFSRSQIGAVFLDNKALVLLDPTTQELVREKPVDPATEVADAFRAHGYPWTEADPHLESYQLWVPDLPGLPDGVNALLTARARAIEKKQKDDVAELRREVARLGIFVRDNGKRQYWRRLDQTPR
jgi:hypothetical protein